jgi:hypothetical protein
LGTISDEIRPSSKAWLESRRRLQLQLQEHSPSQSLVAVTHVNSTGGSSDSVVLAQKSSPLFGEDHSHNRIVNDHPAPSHGQHGFLQRSSVPVPQHQLPLIPTPAEGRHLLHRPPQGWGMSPGLAADHRDWALTALQAQARGMCPDANSTEVAQLARRLVHLSLADFLEARDAVRQLGRPLPAATLRRALDHRIRDNKKFGHGIEDRMGTY